jgi:hypothetical protein
MSDVLNYLIQFKLILKTKYKKLKIIAATPKLREHFHLIMHLTFVNTTSRDDTGPEANLAIKSTLPISAAPLSVSAAEYCAAEYAHNPAAHNGPHMAESPTYNAAVLQNICQILPNIRSNPP